MRSIYLRAYLSIFLIYVYLSISLFISSIYSQFHMYSVLSNSRLIKCPEDKTKMNEPEGIWRICHFGENKIYVLLFHLLLLVSTFYRFLTDLMITFVLFISHKIQIRLVRHRFVFEVDQFQRIIWSLSSTAE